MNGSKSPLRSKTFWLGIVMIAMAFLIPLLGTEFVQDHPAVMFTIVILLGVTIIVLRFCTVRPVSLRQNGGTQNKVECGPCNRFVNRKNSG